MKIIESKSDFTGIEKSQVLTIGNFDGLHLGHRRIIDTARQAGQKRNLLKLAVMTFFPHPVTILHPEKSPGVLTPLPVKKHLLGQAGVDYLIVLKDCFDLLNLSPKDFIDEFLMKTIRPSVIVEGRNFNFGYGRSGDVDTLIQLGGERDFDVIVSESENVTLSDGQKVLASSSLVRNLLEKGRVADAALILARPYRLIGQVTQGRGKGRDLGFPTANLHPIGQIIPGEGVYAGFVEIGDSCQQIIEAEERIPAVFSIGRAKTFITEHPLLIEAHIIGRQVGDLADKWLAMDFVDHIRQQRRFKTEAQLSRQIKDDCEKTKEILATKS